MKTIKQTILGIALCVFSWAVNAQCTFTLTNLNVSLGSNGTATITPVTTGTTSPMFTNYYWQIYPNGAQNNSSTQSMGEFQFPANGTYSVCLNISDSLNGCWSNQYCTSVTISNMSASSCNAAFTAYTDSNCVTYFVDGSTGSNLSHQWHINGTTYYTANPNVTLPNGSYPVVLETFSNGAFCDSTYQYVTVGCGGTNTVSCQASFVFYTDSSCLTHFTNTSTGTNLTYYWYDMSNGFSLLSTGTDLSVNLGDSINYIGLYAYSNGTFCDSATAYINTTCNSGGPSGSCQASYTYYRDSTCVTHFINTSTGSNLTYSWNIDGTTYSTANPVVYLLSGYHNVSLYTYSNGSFCDSIGGLNSYLVNSCSTNTTTPAGCQANSQFVIFADSSNTGNYFAYNLSSGSGNLSYLWNFGDGTSSTQQYPFHQYAVPAQYIVCLTVTGTYTNTFGGVTTCSDTYCDSSSVQKTAAFLMSQMNVIPQSVTGIKQTEFSTLINAYPNPMTDELTIESSVVDSKLTYILMDALGRTILSGNLENSKATLNTGSLAKGFYSLSLSNEKGNALKTIKLVK
jgi:hypothetical protein